MKKLNLLALILSIIPIVSSANFPSPEQMVQYYNQNPGAVNQPAISEPSLIPAEQMILPQRSIAQQHLMTTDPATSFMAPEPLSQRAPNFAGLEYQAPSENSVALYYQIQKIRWRTNIEIAMDKSFGNDFTGGLN